VIRCATSLLAAQISHSFEALVPLLLALALIREIALPMLAPARAS